MKYCAPSHVAWAVAVALTIAGCATTGTRTGTKREPKPAELSASKISYQSNSGEHLGLVIRHIGANANAGIVLMQGLEWRQAGALSFSNASLEDVAQKVASGFNGKVQICPRYVFLYPSGYEMLEQVSLEAHLEPTLAAQPVAIGFGAGTPLYTIFAVIGRTLKTTIIADNAIAQAECGELALPEMPLQDALEAVLKSARVPNDAIEVRSEGGYTFIRNRDIPEAGSIVINASSLGDEQRRLLDKRVSLELPYPQKGETDLTVFAGASSLEDILTSMSDQLGVNITAETNLAKIPVNPMVVHDLPLGTAIELLIRQWLVPQYGYTVEPDRIVIRQVPQS